VINVNNLNLFGISQKAPQVVQISLRATCGTQVACLRPWFILWA